MALETYPSDPRGVPTSVKPVGDPLLGGLSGDRHLAAVVDAWRHRCMITLGRTRLKPSAADIMVHARPPTLPDVRPEIADTAKVAKEPDKCGLHTRCVGTLQHRLQRERKQQRTQGIALSYSTL